MSKLLAIGLAFAVVSSCVNATETNRKSDELIQVLQYDVQIQMFIDSCFEGAVHTSPEDLLKSNPYYFGGYNPDSPEWPRVVDIYNQYYERACEYVDGELFKKTASDEFALALSNAELNEAIAFYSTPVGQKIVKASARASKAFNEVAQMQYSKYFRRATILFQQELADLVRESQLKDLE
ncbi:DUF2059 domain-containing protein [Agarivorans sp. DSG3-1]|uniref:DUF2059 domain-containing protein n=1 Tax=Agarivorans sp. DSG3-1 TaxID=3342249 RepID=UPI00398F3690